MEGAAGRDLGPWDHGTVSFESRDRCRTLSAKQWAEAGYKRPRPQSSLSHGSNVSNPQIHRKLPQFSQNFFRVIGSVSVRKAAQKSGTQNPKISSVWCRDSETPGLPRSFPYLTFPDDGACVWTLVRQDVHRLNSVELSLHFRWTSLNMSSGI